MEALRNFSDKRIFCMTCCGPKEETESVSVVAQAQEVNRYPPAMLSTAVKEGTKDDGMSVLAAMKKKDRKAVKPQGPVQLGKPCTSRFPQTGDLVLSAGGKRTGHDTEGRPKEWVLMPWQVAEVVEVDTDGDFRLVNENGKESGFMFRSEFVYVASPDEEPAEARLAKALGRFKPFEVKLTRPVDQQWGLMLDHVEGNCEIVKIISGACAAYNKDAPKAANLYPGDFIVGLNGKKPSEVMAKELEKTDVQITVAPRFAFKATITKPAGEMPGLTCTFKDTSASLVVTQVHQNSPAATYNARSVLDVANRVRIGDRISEVNGKSGNPKEMLQEMQATSCMELVVGRPQA